MTYRHEWKHIISLPDMIVLQGRLPAVMQHDPGSSTLVTE